VRHDRRRRDLPAMGHDRLPALLPVLGLAARAVVPAVPPGAEGASGGPVMTAGLFAAVFAALYAGHQVADHWVQTPCQAAGKGLPGWPGRLACARHVAALTITAAVALTALAAVTGAPVRLLPAAAGLAVNAVSHYAADRRRPLLSLAGWLSATVIPGKEEFWHLGAPRRGHDDNPCFGTGAYALDQSWHVGWLFISALIIAGGAW
jgi:hypothetical protein